MLGLFCFPFSVRVICDWGGCLIEYSCLLFLIVVFDSIRSAVNTSLVESAGTGILTLRLP